MEERFNQKARLVRNPCFHQRRCEPKSRHWFQRIFLDLIFPYTVPHWKLFYQLFSQWELYACAQFNCLLGRTQHQVAKFSELGPQKANCTELSFCKNSAALLLANAVFPWAQKNYLSVGNAIPSRNFRTCIFTIERPG